MANNNTKTNYQTALTLLSPNYGAVMGHLDCWVSAKVDPKFFPATDGKKARFTFAVTTNRPTFELLGAAEGDAKKYAGKPESHMLYCTAFGTTAEKLKDVVQVKSHLVLNGRLNRTVFTDRNGVEHESVALTVFHCVSLASFDAAPKYMSAMKGVNRKGEEFTMIAGGAGKITYVGELQNGTRDNYLHFTVELTAPIDAAYAQANGNFDKSKKYDTKTVSVTLWGSRADAMVRILKPGMPIVVSGSVTTADRNGRTYYNMSAQGISLYPRVADPNAAAAAAGAAAAANPAGYPGDDYDEPPFGGQPNFDNAIGGIDDEENELPF